MDALCQTRLNRFPRVVVFDRAALEAAAVQIVGAFHRHVTLAAEHLDDLVRKLLDCPHTTRPNPCYEAEATERLDDPAHRRPAGRPEQRSTTTGLPWAFLDEARDQSVIVEGAWIVVGSGQARAVAQVADIDNDIVHVRPLPGPVRRHEHLLGHAVA